MKKCFERRARQGPASMGREQAETGAANIVSKVGMFVLAMKHVLCRRNYYEHFCLFLLLHKSNLGWWHFVRLMFKQKLNVYLETWL